jgi:hypothetical protein
MANMDKLILWGAAALMAAVGSLSAWKIGHEPTIAPEIVTLEREHESIRTGGRRFPLPEPVPGIRLRYLEAIAEPKPAPDDAGTLRTRARGCAINEPCVTVMVLPFPIVGEAKADLDGATITWSLVERPVALRSSMIRTEAKPTGFIIERQCEDGPVQEIGRVGPKERSFTDLSTEPRLTYRYWVLVAGEESSLKEKPFPLTAVTKGLPLSAEARTPAATRMKLIGGDKDNGILRAETYDRAQKKWVGKLIQVPVGKGIGASGWTLNRLRFVNFTLAADVTDDEGVDRVLTTKN